jgi:hypothetical protein
MKSRRTAVTVIIFLLCAAGIAVFAVWSSLDAWPFGDQQPLAQYRTRLITPTVPGNSDADAALTEYMIYDDNYSLKAPLGEGELALSVLNIDLDNSAIEEQVVVYRSLTDTENPVAITFFGYDERSKGYRRLWSAPVAATMPGTVSLYSQDLIGDRSFCVIITGMNTRGEHTMTVFRHDEGAMAPGHRSASDHERPFTRIAQITMDGSITIQESERSLAYQQGIANGQPFTITASGRDGESANIMDRIAISHVFNPVRGIYEQSRVTRVPGSQIGEHRLQTILTGNPHVFEEFIYDLWYHLTPEGTIDKSQYLYFDPEKREIIFFGDETQQVFSWIHSTSTRYGLYISSQNISVSTLRRFLDIELESLDRIRLRINEDIRLKINVSAPWNGSYRRAGAITHTMTDERPARPYADAVYDSSMGRLRFNASGEYELSSSGILTKGRYAFFRVGNHDLLELRPERNSANGETRLVYSLAGMDNPENLSLSPVRLGASGVHDLHEVPIILTKAQ